MVGHQWGQACDVGLDPGWWDGLVDHGAQRLDRLVGQALALVAGEEHLGVGGLAVGTLRPGRGQRVAPEVLDMRDVSGVGGQSRDEVVVVGVRLGAEGLLALDDDHGRVVGVELAEDFSDMAYRDQRRGVLGRQRHVVRLGDLFQRGNAGGGEGGQRHPGQEDRHGQAADDLGDHAGLIRTCPGSRCRRRGRRPPFRP